MPTKHILPHTTSLCSVFTARVHFIWGDKSFVGNCPSNPTDGWRESRHRAKKWSSKKKKKHNIFLNDQSPFRSGLLSILNITSAVSLTRHAGFRMLPRADETPSTGASEARHASFFNIILKWNWLHLNRHGDKSHQHLAEAGFIADGTITVPAEHHLLTCDRDQHYCTMMELLRRRSRQIERVNYGCAKGWRCSQTFLFILSGVERGQISTHWKVKNGINSCNWFKFDFRFWWVLIILHQNL